ncbi:MAG: stalk domain-containing protein [Bacillota bacterium]|nr:stalk domain-containing protein [Bacillota bacterium]
MFGLFGRRHGHQALGVIPSPPDERDYPYLAYGELLRAEQLPERYTVTGIEQIDNQGKVEACVACSLGLVKDWQEGLEFGRPVRFSRQFIYSHRPEPAAHRGPGMIPRQALAGLRRYGAPPESMWPGLAEVGREQWPPDKEKLLHEAWPYRVATYVRVDPSFIREIKSAVFSLGPVLYCVPLHVNFRPGPDGRILMPKGAIEGYHAMAIVGWRSGYWLVQNSWGPDWGQSGRCWIPWEFPALELWTITDAETRRTRTAVLTVGSRTATVDGQTVTMEGAPLMREGETYAPVRSLAAALGAELRVDVRQRTFSLTLDVGPRP